MTRSRVAALFATVLVLGLAAPAGAAVPTQPPQAHEAADCSFPVTLTDGTGTEVSLAERPERVVVLGGSAAQTTWELGAEDRVVGIDAFSTYLEGAGAVPVVSGGIGRVDYEAALNQSPDLIVVAGNSYSQEVVTEFRRSDVPVFAMPDAGNLTAVYDKTVTFGQLLGACETAHDVVADMRDRVETVREAVADEPRPGVFVDFGAVRNASARYSTTVDSFVGATLETAGGANIVAEGDFGSFPQVSNEFILQQDPEYLVVTYTPGSQFGASTAEGARAAARNVSVFQDTTAVEEGNIIAVNANNLNQPAPRIVRALETLVQALHPEAYAAANSTTTAPEPTTTAGSTTTGSMDQTTAPTTTDTPTSGDGGPGFGPALTGVAAALALAAALLVRRD